MVDRFRAWLGNRPPSLDLLVKYLDTLPAEGTWLEFKACESNIGIGVTRSVAAFANSPDGGEVFVGVADDRRVLGSDATHQQVEQLLEQQDAPAEGWYVVNLLQAVRSVTTVRVGEKFAFAIDVSHVPLPALVRVPPGVLALYLRNGSSSIRVSSVEAMRWTRQSTRARLLLTIFLEFEIMVKQVRLLNGHSPRTSWGIPPRLPFLVRSMEDGSFYTILEHEDVRAILGTRGEGPNSIEDGFMTSFLNLEADVARTKEVVAGWGRSSDRWEEDRLVLNQIMIRPDKLDADVARFRAWLIEHGIIPRIPSPS